GVEQYTILWTGHHLSTGGMLLSEIAHSLSNYYNDDSFKYAVSLEIQQSETLFFTRKMQRILETHRDVLMNFWRTTLAGGQGVNLDFLKSSYKSDKDPKGDKLFRYYSVPIKQVEGLSLLKSRYGVTDYAFYITVLSVLFYKHLYEPPSKLIFSLPYLVTKIPYIQGVNNIFIPFCITNDKHFCSLLEDVQSFFKTIRKSLVEGADVLPAYTPTYWIIEAGEIQKLDKLIGLAQQDQVRKLLFSFDGTVKDEGRVDTVMSSRFPDRLNIHIQKIGEQGIRFFVECQELGLNGQLMDAFFERYFKLLEDILIDERKPIGEYNILTAKEYQYLVYDYNKTEKDYPQDKTIHQLFEEQVARTPNNIAVVFEDKQLTYQALNNKSNQLAHYLHDTYKTKADDIICLLLERSEWMIIAILGVLKSGAAYCPISPEYPEDRVQFILEDTQPKCLIVNIDVAVKNIHLPIVDLRSSKLLQTLETLTINHSPLIINNLSLTITNLAYIIYTSGTTGKPKGAMLEHRGIVNRILWMQSEYPLTEQDRVLQKTNYAFDVSVWELFWANWVGATIVFLKQGAEKDAVLLSRKIEEEKITVMHFVPSALGAFLEATPIDYSLSSLKYVFCSGESLGANIVRQFKKIFPNIAIHNLYGPTEASIDVLYADCNNLSDEMLVPIGKPIDNTSVYILDEGKGLLPQGCIGELYIGGDGVARGYLNRPELTAERFGQNPFQTEEDKRKNRNGRLYKTGDLVRMLPDGNIEYIGRNDFQVKIRGYRIELGEIENKILEFKNKEVINQAVVLVNDKGDNKYLVGYLVAKEEIDIEDLRSYLTRALPDHMVPTAFVQLDKLPLTVNGKLDRKALLHLDINFGTEIIELPKNPTEEKLLGICSRLLNIPESELSVTQSFFRLGGNSIMSIRLMNEINKEFQTSISVRMIFERNTIRQLANYLSDGNTEQIAVVQQSFNKVEDQILSYAQNRLWFIYQYDKANSAVYNIPMVWELDNSVDINKLSDALLFVVKQHEILRTVIEQNNEGLTYQVVREVGKDLIQEEYYTTQQDLKKQVLALVKYNFQLDQEIPIQIKFFNSKKKTGKTLLVIVIHHIAFDGWSVGILQKDIQRAYQLLLYNEPLVFVDRLQYKDYALWQRHFLDGTRWDKELNYWQHQLAGYNNSA
ncbi:MAG: amino acid adenylation domain-containing protein, partial [Phycisphaerales bacterium]|nr:amino acid adenylation domain-containing protein [Phycisphaerales bacterium]